MDDFKDIPRDLPEVRGKGLAHKVFVGVSGTFLILLFLSYFLVGPNTMGIIAGMVSSDTVNEDSLVVKAGSLTIKFNPEAYSGLKYLYIQNEGKEFKACLHGVVQDNLYIINQVNIPQTSKQAFDHVIAEPCPADALIDLHSHPLGHCTPSYQDVKLLRRIKNYNPGIVMVVMCDLDRFTFYP